MAVIHINKEKGAIDKSGCVFDLSLLTTIHDKVKGSSREVENNYLFFTDAEKRLIQFLGSEAMTVVIPDGFYEKIHNQYADRLAEVDKKELYIDLMWASLFLKE